MSKTTIKNIFTVVTFLLCIITVISFIVLIYAILAGYTTLAVYAMGTYIISLPLAVFLFCTTTPIGHCSSL